MKTRSKMMAWFSLALIFVLIACGQAPSPPTAEPQAATAVPPTSTPLPTSTPIPTATPIPTPTPWPILVSDKLPAAQFTLDDPDSSVVWWEKRTITGDNYYTNQLERPFTSKEMVYQPDIDILHADIASDDKFFYFTITLRDVDKDSQALSGYYGIEFDRTKTGRGDLLVWVHAPPKEWTVAGIQIFIDNDRDVGGPNPNLSNPDFEGSGFDMMVNMTSEKVAYARFVPGEPPLLQVAVSRLLLNNANEFLWSIWADKGLMDPGKYYYHDHFTFREAGSPIKADEVYPLAAVYSVDNTCSQPYGFAPAEYIPGMCQTGSGSGSGTNGGGCVCLRPGPNGCALWNLPNCP